MPWQTTTAIKEMPNLPMISSDLYLIKLWQWSVRSAFGGLGIAAFGFVQDADHLFQSAEIGGRLDADRLEYATAGRPDGTDDADRESFGVDPVVSGCDHRLANFDVIVI